MKSGAAQRVKKTAADYPIPHDRDEADEFIYKIGEAIRDRRLAETAMNEDLAKIKAEYEAKAEPATAAIERYTAGLQTWCEAHRHELLKADSKTVKFGNGEVSWRARPESVSLRGVEKIIEWCRKRKLLKFLREKTEVNKEAMLADPVEAKKIPGVKIASSGEDFIVTPFESALEDVA